MKNMGTADRWTRVGLAIVLITLYATNTVTGTLGLVFVIAGGVFMLTSLVGFCPLYAPFGIRTCPKKN